MLPTSAGQQIARGSHLVGVVKKVSRAAGILSRVLTVREADAAQALQIKHGGNTKGVRRLASIVHFTNGALIK